MRTSKDWWYRFLTIADLGIYSSDEILTLDPAELAEKKKALGFNVEHLTCSDTYGGEKGIFYFRSSVAEKVPRDFIGEYIPEAHKRGLKVLIYFNVHWLQKEFAMKHLDWLQRDSKGEIIDTLYGSGCAPCVNSPFRQWSFQVIKDLAKYDIDGIFLDGPIFAPEACYCDNCRRIFKENYGLEVPKWQDWESASWRKFLEFRYESIARYLRDAKSVLNRVKPEALLYMNCTGLWPAWPAARDNRRLMPFQDMLGAEGGFLYSDLRQIPLWKPGMAAKLLEVQAEGKPTVVFIAGAHKPWDKYLLTPAETKILYADTVANGANPWYGVPLKLIDKLGAQAAAEMNHFLVRNREYYENTRSSARVAIYWSCKTADFYRASVPVTDFTPQGERLETRRKAGNYYASFVGCYEILLRSHIPFDVLDDVAVSTGNLNRYDLVFIPNCACISEDNIVALKEYMQNGGNIVSSFEASLFDEHGDRREDFGLSEVFGVSVGKGVFGPMTLDYMSIVAEASYIMDGTSANLLPCPTYGIYVEQGTASPLAYYHKKMPARYVKLPPISGNPAILLNKYGRGKCLYMAGNFFESYFNFHNPDYRKIITNAVKAFSKPTVSTRNCPSSVEITFRRQDSTGRFIIHLINFTGEMVRPIEKIVALKDIEITVHEVQKVRKVKALKLNQELKFKVGSNGIVVRLPVLQEYEALVIETT